MQQEKPTRIALFDSGVGGLSVLRQLVCRSAGSKTKFIYLADTGRCPYGNRSFAEIAEFVEQICKWFAGLGVDRIVMACNTSAAVAGPQARNLVNVPVHDIITPAAFHAANNYDRVAVMATATTCRTKVFSKVITSFNTRADVLEIPCPDLVPLVESGTLDGDEVERTVRPYVEQLVAANSQAVILGCTHFPFLADAIRRMLPDGIDLVDPAEHLSLDILGPSAAADVAPEVYGEHTYFTTGTAELFSTTAERCLSLPAGVTTRSVCSLDVADLIAAARTTASKRPGATTMVFSNPGSNLHSGV